MKFTISTFIALMLLLTSCDSLQKVQKTEFDTLFAEVMKIHDDVMPETNNLYKLKKIAQENIAVLPDTSSMIKELMDIQLLSDKADDAMMDWMANFKIPESDHKSKITYLQNEKIAITDVRGLMLSTIYKGKSLIRKSDKYIKKNKLRDERKTNLVPAF